jgi:tryptophan-rich sensory protein
MKRLFIYVGPILLCFIVGWISMLFQSNSLVEWYPLLNKPSVTPPNVVFPIAWSILYICIGLSLGRLLDCRERRFVGLWFLQLALNFLWTPMFFFMHSAISGLVIIIFLDIAVLTYIIVTWRISKLASLLMWPYLLWLGFASYLNLYIWLNN